MIRPQTVAANRHSSPQLLAAKPPCGSSQTSPPTTSGAAQRQRSADLVAGWGAAAGTDVYCTNRAQDEASPGIALAAVAVSNRRGSPLSVRQLFTALGARRLPHAGCIPPRRGQRSAPQARPRRQEQTSWTPSGRTFATASARSPASRRSRPRRSITLALGVGASAAIFSICQAVLFKPLPYPAPDRIVMVWETEMREGRTSGAAPANFVDWRTRSRSFEQLAALDPFREVTLAGRREPERLNGAAVSATFFPLLGTRLALGRSFSTDDEQPGRDRVVVLSHALWQRSFGSDPAVIGASLTLNDTSFTIVGVLPRDFQLVSRAADFNGRDQFDVWMPLALNMERLQRGTHPLRVFGRLRTNIRDAQAELDVVASTLRRDHPRTNADRGIRLVPLSEQVAAGIRTPLLMLLGAVGFLLLIACVNVANLLLTRATARRKEMAVRLALGAGRLRLARQLVTESLLLTSIAAAAGTGIAWAALTALVRRLPFDLPRTAEIGLNAEVVGVVGLVSLAAGVVFGCAPLLHGVAASASLKTGQQTPSRAQGRTQSGLVVVQIALACVLLVGAGLMGRSLWALLSVAPGFEADRVLTARLALTSRLSSDVRRIATFQRELLARVNRLPGARSAGFGGYLPLGGSGNSWAPAIEGRAPLAPGERIQYRPVTPGYIESLAIPLVEGRLLTEADREDAPAVAIVNLAAARRYWPNESPIGRRLQIDGGPPWRTVIGVVGDVRHQGLDAAAQPELYIPFAQTPYPNATMTLVVRTNSDPTHVRHTCEGSARRDRSELAAHPRADDGRCGARRRWERHASAPCCWAGSRSSR